ncbi:ATP-grasp domain-containing protein [Anatilimnocola floriformis]|uniref:ATP-grasp domain-containing protein n=1 Tax=Anatilimnocola floriformis TaxID=2948575 RepID=UPI0020C1EBDF|nr:ATP-grasp domain-containing protein [Anatilimnocola floriformis]
MIAGAKELPAMPPVSGPLVLHGRTTLILRALESPVWRRRIFFEPAHFCHRAYVEGWGDRVLNAAARITTWEKFIAEAHTEAELFFLKPNDDLKQFTGGVQTFGQALALFQHWQQRGWPVVGTEVVVARPSEIDAEWRLFVVEGRVITGSMYRPSATRDVPREAIEIVENAVACFSPAPVFALDICRCQGEWKIVEANCFNGSRFYLSDVQRLVEAISEFQERES